MQNVLALTIAATVVSFTPILGLAHPDIEAFADVDFVEAPDVVECTLTDGSAADCYQFTVSYLPDDLKTGPYCPTTLDDAGGIWD